MKSTKEQLAARGFLSDPSYEKMPDFNVRQLIQSQIPRERTRAVRKIRHDGDDSFLPQLVDMLKREKALYTKIELCECLAGFGLKALPFLLPLLGRIGGNQHKAAALVDINKKSFPLPRDIVARIIVRIGSPALPSLREVLRSGDRTSLLEAIDAVGHIAFTTKDLSLVKDLVSIYRSEPDDELVRWKLVRSFQAFGSVEVKSILREIVESDMSKAVFKAEAQRSLKRIGEREG